MPDRGLGLALAMRFLLVFNRVKTVCGLSIVVAASAGILTAAQAQLAGENTPAVSSSVFSASTNVLILALDEADINSARSANLVDTPGTRSSAPRPNAAPAGAQGQVPATWSQPVRPLNPIEELPAVPAAIAPIDYSRDSGITWSAHAQIANSSRAIPDLPGISSSDIEAPSTRPPGRAQSAAAPLRRALGEAGVRDVMVAPLDGPTVVRTVNAGRIDVRVIDRLRFATQQMLKSPNAKTEELDAGAAQSRQDAVRAASRIGISMGYRAVIVLAISPRDEYSYLLVDAARETGEVFVWNPAGGNSLERDKSVSAIATPLLLSEIRQWPAFSSSDRTTKLESHMAAAREAIERNERERAKDHLAQAIALDPTFVDAYILLGDVLQNNNPKAAASAYQRAIEINTRNGEAWARMAVAYTLSTPPDWVRSIQAAGRAIALDYDSANLRTSMAAAEFGRAEMFRRNGRPDQAEDAEKAANNHLDRARELAPNDPDVVAGISRLMAKYLLEQKRFKEAVQSLELLAVQYPNDLQTQQMYAQALEGYGKREEDLFAAWSRVWKLGGESEIALDGARYTRITDGFDQRIFTLARNIFQMTSGVATGALPRETALLQAERSRDEMKTTVASLQLMRPPATRSVSDAHVSRLFAADLMQQAAEFYILYLETGSELNRSRGVEMHRAAIESLNTARGGAAGGGGF